MSHLQQTVTCAILSYGTVPTTAERCSPGVVLLTLRPYPLALVRLLTCERSALETLTRETMRHRRSPLHCRSAFEAMDDEIFVMHFCYRFSSTAGFTRQILFSIGFLVFQVVE